MLSTTRIQPAATVVCLHSSMSHGGQWKALATRLRDHFEVVTPNLLGYDGCGGTFDGAHRLEHEIEVLLPIIEQATDPVHLVGHSFGGAVALRLASLLGDRVASLTVYEPVWFALLFAEDGDGDHAREVIRVRDSLLSESEIGRLRGAREFINYWADGDGWSHIPAEQHARLASLSAKVAAEFSALMAAGPATQEFSRLNVPVRLLCGTDTKVSARRISELLSEIVPGVEYLRLNGLAHMAPVTHADDVNPLIVDHILANVDRGERAVA
ncbi:MAG: alpha/beta hydrolase [Pseudomonadota bacterium]